MGVKSVNSNWGLVWAGLTGGPLALMLLMYRDLKVMGRSKDFRRVFLWFAPLIGIWCAAILIVPPDFISQLIPYIPQVAVWGFVSRHLFIEAHIQYKVEGGKFFSPWRSAWFGFLVFAALRLAIFGLKEITL